MASKRIYQEYDIRSLLPITCTTNPSINVYTLEDDLGKFQWLLFTLDLTAVTGGDTITFQVMDSADGENFSDISGDNFGGALNTISVVQQITTQFAKYIRIEATVAGGPGATFTFSLKVAGKG